MATAPITEQQFRLAEIEVSRSSTEEKLIGVFRYESEGRARRNPTTVIIAEIASNLYVYEQLLDVINETAEQARHLTSGFEGDPMARFEKLVQKLNDGMASFAEQVPTPLTWNRVNMFVIELSENHLCLSGIGRLCNVFLQKQPDGSYRPFDLFGSLEQPAEVQSDKPFSSLICGDMKPGDLLFAGTMNFERLRHELRLIDRLSTLPAVTAALEIKQDLEVRDIPDDFGGIVIASVSLPVRVPATTLESAETKKGKSTESIEKMYQEERTTEAMLSPAVAPIDLAPSKDPAWWKRMIGKITDTIKSSASAVTERWRKPASPQDPVALASLRGMNAGHGSFISGRRKKTVLLTGATILVVILGTFWYSQSKKAAAEQTLWTLTLEQIADQKTRADADLVYGNEDRARRTLQGALEQLASLDEKTSTRQQAKAKLMTELEEIRKKLKHEIRVDQPAVLFTAPSDLAPGSVSAIGKWNNKVYALTGPTSLVEIHTGNGEHRTIALTHATATAINLLPGKTALYLLMSDQSLSALTTGNGELSSVPFATSQVREMKDALLYGARLYALDPAGGTLWRFAPLGSGFGSGQGYIKQTQTPISEARSLTIDSSVYVGFQNGRIVRYLSGVEESWMAATVDPPVQTATKLWTTTETDRLVVLDATTKRIIVLRKDGGVLISQIVSTELKDPIALTGDDKLKKIYVTDSNRVLQFDLP